MASLTTYHDLCCHPLHSVVQAEFLENVWQDTFTPQSRLCEEERGWVVSQFTYGRLEVRCSPPICLFYPQSFLLFFPICNWQNTLCVCVLGHFSHAWHFATLWTVAHQAPLSIGFSRQEYWNGWPCPPPADLSDPGIEPTSPVSPALQADSLPTAPPGKPKIHFRWAKYVYIFIVVCWTLFNFNSLSSVGQEALWRLS